MGLFRTVPLPMYESWVLIFREDQISIIVRSKNRKVFGAWLLSWKQNPRNHFTAMSLMQLGQKVYRRYRDPMVLR